MNPKSTNILQQWVQNPSKIDRNMILCVFGGRGPQGRLQDGHTRWVQSTFVAPLAENGSPMADFGNHFGAMLGATFGPEPGNASKWHPGSLLERLLGLSLEMLQNGFLEASWSDFWAWA